MDSDTPAEDADNEYEDEDEEDESPAPLPLFHSFTCTPYQPKQRNRGRGIRGFVSTQLLNFISLYQPLLMA